MACPQLHVWMGDLGRLSCSHQTVLIDKQLSWGTSPAPTPVEGAIERCVYSLDHRGKMPLDCYSTTSAHMNIHVHTHMHTQRETETTDRQRLAEIKLQETRVPLIFFILFLLF